MAEDKGALFRALGQKEEKRSGWRKETGLPAGLPEVFSSPRALSLVQLRITREVGERGKELEKTAHSASWPGQASFLDTRL